MEAEIVEKKQTDIIVKINSKGLLDFKNQLELKRAADLAIQLDFAPDQLKKKGIPAVMAALLACKQYSLPQKCMAQMGYINGKITMYGSLITALAERHPMFGERNILFIDEKQEVISYKNKNLNESVWGCVILSKRRGDSEFSEFTFTKADAEKADLLNPGKNEWVNGKPTGKKIPNPESPWVKYTKDMLYHKANKRCLDSQYASAIEGINYHEDLMGIKEEPERDVTQESFQSFEKIIAERAAQETEVVQ